LSGRVANTSRHQKRGQREGEEILNKSVGSGSVTSKSDAEKGGNEEPSATHGEGHSGKRGGCSAQKYFSLEEKTSGGGDASQKKDRREREKGKILKRVSSHLTKTRRRRENTG